MGIRLAEALGGKFLSSGEIIRAAKDERNSGVDKGELAPTNVFYELVLPYFEREDLLNYPLVLSSIGRWHGEEGQVMSVAAGAGHPIKAAVILNVSEADVAERWEAAKMLGDRGLREDDKSPEVFKKRILEFREKTLPVLMAYRDLGLVVEVRADMPRDEVFVELVNRLYDFASRGEA